MIENTENQAGSFQKKKKVPVTKLLVLGGSALAAMALLGGVVNYGMNLTNSAPRVIGEPITVPSAPEEPVGIEETPVEVPEPGDLQTAVAEAQSRINDFSIMGDDFIGFVGQETAKQKIDNAKAACAGDPLCDNYREFLADKITFHIKRIEEILSTKVTTAEGETSVTDVLRLDRARVDPLRVHYHELQDLLLAWEYSHKTDLVVAESSIPTTNVKQILRQLDQAIGATRQGE